MNFNSSTKVKHSAKKCNIDPVEHKGVFKTTATALLHFLLQSNCKVKKKKKNLQTFRKVKMLLFRNN